MTIAAIHGTGLGRLTGILKEGPQTEILKEHLCTSIVDSRYKKNTGNTDNLTMKINTAP